VVEVPEHDDPGEPERPGALARAKGRATAVATPLLEKAEEGSAKVSGRFSSPLHDEWVAAVLGIALGVAFTVCFLTGLVDYLAQHPPHWFHLPVAPVNLYRVTEGVHILTGIATIPLLLAKLWTVWPKLFAWPPIADIAQALERLSLIPLVGGSLFLLFTGVVNIDYWYGPMPFFFPTAHFWTAWMVVGALVVHIGAKTATARTALARGPHPDEEGDDEEAGAEGVAARPEPAGVAARLATPRPAGLGRRGFLATLFATAGLLVVVVAGETVAPLRKLALLAPRNPTVGPQSLPVNQTAVEAGVTTSAVDPSYRLEVSGNCRSPRSFTLDQLRALPQRSAGLPITCVEGWSAAAAWRGISLPALLALVGAPAGSPVEVVSLEDGSRLYSSSVVDSAHASHPDTLLALELNGAALDLDHGYPLRLIAPDRPGVLQTKWVHKVVVL